MKKENLAIIEMLICATLWSIAGIFMKLLPWNGFAVAGLRSLIAGLTIAAYILIKGMRIIINRRTLVTGVFTACVYTCFAVANKLTTAANAIVLQFTSPVFIVIFSALILKKRIRRSDALVVSFTLIGIALFFFDQLRPGYILGNFVAIAAGMFMAGMFMAVGELEGEQRFSGILIGQTLTFLVGLPFVIATRPEFTAVTTRSGVIASTMVSRRQGMARSRTFWIYRWAYSGPVSSSWKVWRPKPLWIHWLRMPPSSVSRSRSRMSSTPLSRAATAAASPAGPPPMITRSQCFIPRPPL